MTIKDYETRLRKIDKDSIFSKEWQVIILDKRSLLVTHQRMIQFGIYDLGEPTGAWVSPAMDSNLFSNGGLDRTIEILQVTNEFIKSYED